MENISEFSSLLFIPDVELRAYSIYLVCIGFSIPTQFILAGWMRSTPAILPRTLGQSRKGALAHLGWGGRGWCGRGSAGHSGSSDKTQKRWPGHRVVGARFKERSIGARAFHFRDWFLLVIVWCYWDEQKNVTQLRMVSKSLGVFEGREDPATNQAATTLESQDLRTCWWSLILACRDHRSRRWSKMVKTCRTRKSHNSWSLGAGLCIQYLHPSSWVHKLRFFVGRIHVFKDEIMWIHHISVE